MRYEDEINNYLDNDRIKRVSCFDNVDSTNLRLKELAVNNAPAGYVIIADSQTNGRGRMGRNFSSPKSSGIYMSYLLRPDCKPSETITLTGCVASAVISAIKAVCGIAPGVKWVNDLIMNKHKICGILTEMSIADCEHVNFIVAGIGINVNQDINDFPDEIRGKASSISAEYGQKIDRAYLVSEIIKNLDLLSTCWPKEITEYLSIYRQNCITIGSQVQVIRDNNKFEAYADSIGDDFSLHVTYPDGKKENLASGEVSVRGMYDYV